MVVAVKIRLTDVLTLISYNFRLTFGYHIKRMKTETRMLQIENILNPSAAYKFLEKHVGNENTFILNIYREEEREEEREREREKDGESRDCWWYEVRQKKTRMTLRSLETESGRVEIKKQTAIKDVSTTDNVRKFSSIVSVGTTTWRIFRYKRVFALGQKMSDCKS